MEDETENLLLKDLPEDTFDWIAARVAESTIGVFRLLREGSSERLISIGAGTLVVVGGQHGILTAEHVLAELRSGDQLALITDFSGKLSTLRFDLQHIQIHRIARGGDDSRGPDIGFVVFSPNDLGTLRAQKTFFNVDSRVDRFSSGYVDLQSGFWFSCGMIGEFERNLPVRPGFSSIKGCRGLCGASTKPREYQEGDFDYLEIDVRRMSAHPELPNSFGGMSGGGIWQVPLRKSPPGLIEPQELILSGVIFYQTAKVDDARILRGHGRRTLYEYLPRYIRTV